MKLSCVSLQKFNQVRFIELVNDIFKDYIIPIRWDIYDFELDARENSISFDDSFVFLEDEEPISFILVCIRKNRARIDAMGVVKEKRSMGIGNYMMEYVMERLRWKKINKVVLEVMENDEKAIKFYMKNKFRHVRKLISFVKKGLPDGHKFNFAESNNTRIYELSTLSEKLFRRKSNWQREPLTLMLSERRYNTMEIKSKGRVIGYLVWGKKQDVAFIVDCSRVDYSVSLTDILDDSLRYIKDSSGVQTVQIMNLPEDDPLKSAVDELQFSKFIGQFEMERRI